MLESIVAFLLFCNVHLYYWPDLSKRSWKQLALIEYNTLYLFFMTWYCLPETSTWDFQPMYLALLPIWGDLWVYTTHRLLHSRLLYHHVHYIHHENMLPQPIDTFYAHPLENFLQNWCAIGIPLLTWPSFSSLSVAITAFFFLQNALLAHHSRYDPQGHHILHHTLFSRNLGAGLYLADKLFHTYTDTKYNNQETYNLSNQKENPTLWKT